MIVAGSHSARGVPARRLRSASSRSSRRSRTLSSSSILSALAKERATSAEFKAKVLILQRKQALQNEVERLYLKKN